MIYFAILFLFVIMGIIWKQSKLVLLCLFAILFVVSVSFTEGYDLKNYEYGFNQSIVNVDDVVMYRSVFFATFISLLKLFGLSFQQFRIICFLLWSISIFAFVLKYAKYPTWVIAICTFFPLLTYSSQMRNGMAISIVYLALYYLFNKGGKNRLILYTALIVFAGLIHNISFIYLFGIIAIGDRIKTKSLLYFSITFAVVSVILYGSGLLHWVVLHTMGSYYADLYFAGTDIFLISNTHYYLEIIINLIFSIIVERYERNHLTDDSFMWTFARFVLRLNIILIAAFPALFISMAFYRVFQNMYILTAITVANTSSHYIVNGIDERAVLRYAYLAFYLCLTVLYNLSEGTFMEFFGSIQV